MKFNDRLFYSIQKNQDTAKDGELDMMRIIPQ